MPRHPVPWLAAFGGWLALLCFLSSLHGSPDEPPPFPHFDKFAHFGYFLAGGFLLTGWRFLKNPDRPSWKRLITTTAVVMALTGILDEWHQIHTPGRSGADPWDWIADLLGGTAGAFLLRSIHPRLQ